MLPVCALAVTSTVLAQSTPAPTTAPATEEGVAKPIEMSPFTVDSTRDRGYFAENTLAGSRMNTNIADLGAAISVVTKQMLEDTASVDINDIFRYEISTEGSHTYTPAEASMRNDGPLDVIAGGMKGNSMDTWTNTGANRVRGLGVATSAVNNYQSISRVPIDTYNVQSVEISRGANSILFGMGSPAGVVNQSMAQAVLNRNTNTVSLRTDNVGSFRASLGINRSLIDDKLAIYAAFLYDNKQFERKPSYDTSRRQYGALTFRPFQKTVLRASVENYDNDNRRPNSMTPRDFISDWNMVGRPVYDSVTKMVTMTSTGQVIGPFLSDARNPRAQEVRDYVMGLPNYDPAKRNVQNDATFTQYNGVNIFGNVIWNANGALHVPTLYSPSNARTVMQIHGGELHNWFQPLYNANYKTRWGTDANPTAPANQVPNAFTTNNDFFANPTQADIISRDFLESGGYWPPNNISNYRAPGVTDKSIYDWEKLNIYEMNFGKDRNLTYNIELEQEILHNLHLSAGWFRQDFDGLSAYTVAQLNSAALFVDPNARLPDGSPNPFVGKPYLQDFEPDQIRTGITNDSYRAMLAFTPDFTRRDGILGWLGRHQILGMASKDESQTTNYRNRLFYVDATGTGQFRYLNNQNANADGTPSGWSFQRSSVRRLYYLASPNAPMGSGATSPSGRWESGQFSGDIRAYNYANAGFENVGVTTDWVTHDASTGRSQRELDSRVFGATSYLWRDRLVTTFGIRSDDYKARGTNNWDYTNEAGELVSRMNPRFVNGIYQDEALFDRFMPWEKLSGSTRTLGGVLRPFRNWESVDSRANSGSLFWQFVRDFGVSYNESDNFNPPGAPARDPFGNFLPKPVGETKEMGIQFSLMDNKIFARLNWFESNNQNERTGSAGLDRLVRHIDQTTFRNWARTITMINRGHDPTAEDFGQDLGEAENDAINLEAEKIWQLPYNYYNTAGTAATRTLESKGLEASLNYNPNRNWTNRLTFSKNDTTYRNVLKEFDAWHAVRNPIWQAAKASDYLLPEYQHLATYTTFGGREVDLSNYWSSYGYVTEVRLGENSGNTSVGQYYNNIVANQVALDRDLQGQRARNQRRYSLSYNTRYNFDTGMLKGFSVGGAQRWASKMVVGYRGKPSGNNLANPTRLDMSDLNRPIYGDELLITDLMIGYDRRIMSDRVRMRLQLNVNNVFENGRLEPVQYDYNGMANAFRIIDPRRFSLTATFNF